MEANENFMAEVQSAIPKDAKVVVGCQKGLRYDSTCENQGSQLHLVCLFIPSYRFINGQLSLSSQYQVMLKIFLIDISQGMGEFFCAFLKFAS